MKTYTVSFATAVRSVTVSAKSEAEARDAAWHAYDDGVAMLDPMTEDEVVISMVVEEDS